MQNAAAVNARPRLTRSKALTSLIRWSLTALICFIILLPLWWIFISSITPTSELYQSPIRYLPAHPTFENYLRAVNDMGIASKVKNTLLITACALGGSILLGLMAAYAFARFDRKGIKIAYLALLFSSLIPGIVTARTAYDFFRTMQLIDTYPGLIILYTSALIPFSVLILMNFVQQVPYSIEEAAEVDGANFLQKLFLIILPLMSPAIATIAIINFITCLNDLFTPLFFANRIDVLSVGITTVPRKNTYDVPWDMISTIGCIIILPIIVFVLCFERKIMEGIMAGGVKQ
jgi:ABC-type glycerol-3-phosphate transport system permease component